MFHVTTQLLLNNLDLSTDLMIGAPEVTEVVRDSISLSWAPPRDDGNSPITNYIVEMKKKGDFTWTTANRSAHFINYQHLNQGHYTVTLQL